MSTERQAFAGDHLHWFKSSYSGSDGGDCVEVAESPAVVHVRDSKDRLGPQLGFGTDQWAAFVTDVRGLATDT